MKTSRQRVLDYIRSRKVIGVAELSRALKMTPANARHHLSILQEQGLVQVVGQLSPPGKGRPAQLYSPSEQVESHNLDRLSAAAMNELLVGLDPHKVDQVLGSLAWRLSNDSDDSNRHAGLRPMVDRPDTRPASRSLTQAIYQAVQRLNELHYQARWEAHAQAPRLILGHCPYAAILSDHPELCRMDARLLELMLARKATQAARLAPDPQGGTYCLFILDRQ